MLQQIREKSRGVFGWVLMGSIVFVLTLFGFGAFSAFVSTDTTVAEVGSREITRSELDQAIEQQRRQIMARMGEQADPSQIDDAMLARQVRGMLVQRALLLEAADDAGLAVAESTLDQMIVDMEAFQRNGSFDPDQFRFALSNAGMTPSGFRQSLAEDEVIEQLANGVGDSAFVTERGLARAAALLQQQRTTAWMTFRTAAFEDEVSVDEAALQAHFDDSRERYREREQVRVRYLVLEQDELAEEVELDEATLRGAYERELEAREAESERSASHILLTTSERSQEEALELAESLREQLEQGADFAELAREHSDDPASAQQGGDLGTVEPGAFVEPFEEALFALDEGEVSEPIVTDFGIHLIRLDSIERQSPPSFEERRQALAQQLRERRAAELFAERRRELDERVFEADDLEQPAEALELEVMEAGPFGRDGGQGLWSNEALLEAAFSTDVLEEGYNSEVIELEDGRAVALRVAEHEPARVPEFDEVAEEVRADYVAAEAQRLAEEAARQALERLRDGARSRAVAERYGLEWQRRDALQRHHNDVPGGVRETAFELPRPAADDRSVGMTQTSQGATLVAVTRVTDGQLDRLADGEIDQLRELIRRENGEHEFAGFLQALRARLGVEVQSGAATAADGP